MRGDKKSPIRLHRRTVLGILLPGLLGKIAFGGDAHGMRGFTIEFPDHLLDFSVPEKIAREMSSNQVQEYFDPSSPAAFDRGSRLLARKMYDFDGAVWVGALGSLTFWVVVQQRTTDFEGDITTVRGLKEYISKWDQLVNNPLICKFEETLVNGTNAVSRQFSEWTEIISFPLDQTAFIDFGMRIERVAGKASGGWVRKAEAMRDAIRKTISFRPKSSNRSSQDPRVA